MYKVNQAVTVTYPNPIGEVSNGRYPKISFRGVIIGRGSLGWRVQSSSSKIVYNVPAGYMDRAGTFHDLILPAVLN